VGLADARRLKVDWVVRFYVYYNKYYNKYYGQISTPFKEPVSEVGGSVDIPLAPSVDRF